MTILTSKFDNIVKNTYSPLAVRVGAAGGEQLHEVWEQTVEVREEALAVRRHQRVQHVRHAGQAVHVLVVLIC